MSSASSPTRHSYYHPSSPLATDSMDQLLAPSSVEESLTGTVTNSSVLIHSSPIDGDDPPCHDNNDDDDDEAHLRRVLRHDLQAVRSAVQHRIEEKKVEYSRPAHENHDPADDEGKLSSTFLMVSSSSPSRRSPGNSSFHANTSFEPALGEFQEEFAETEQDVSFSSSPMTMKTTTTTTAHNKTSPESKGIRPTPTTATGKTDNTSSVSGSAALESRRYNDILGLLRNRRQELTAALQKQQQQQVPTSHSSYSRDDEEEEKRNRNGHDNDNQSEARANLTSGRSEDEDVVEVFTKEDDEDEDYETAAKPSSDNNNNNNDNNNKDNSQLEKIESAPQESEQARRQRQPTPPPTLTTTASLQQQQQQQRPASPSSPKSPIRHRDLHSLSPTPPRSPKRTLPYFHKPSGVTPPASPVWANIIVNTSPPRPAVNTTSPKQKESSSPEMARTTTTTSSTTHSSSPRANHVLLTLPKLQTTANDKQHSNTKSNSSTATPALTEANLRVANRGMSLTSMRKSPTSFTAQSDPGGAASSSLWASRTPPPALSHRRSGSPQSEIQGPFTRVAHENSPNREAASVASSETLLRRSPSSKSSPRKGSPFGNGSPHRKLVPPDKIRFRDPYPILRPEKQPREAQAILADYVTPQEHAPIRWVRPKPDLKQLIVAAMGSSLVRRSNACGALKVLTKSKKNQINLFRTDSFLSSILFCASQDISVKERDIALDARTRALACLKAVCEPKMNRAHVVTFPGLLDCLVKVIQTDNGESRALACGALALMAKTADCREEIVKDQRVVKLLAQVLGNRVPVPSPVKEEKKEEDPCPRNGSGDEHTDEDEEEDHSEDEHTEQSGRMGDESTIGDYDTAFAGSMGESFDMQSRVGGPQSPQPYSDEEGEHRNDGHQDDNEEEGEEASYDSEPDAPAMDSIKKKNLERNQTFVQESRASACAVLLHLSRECVLSPLLCNNRTVLDNMILVANESSNVIHTRCLEFLFNLTRFPANNCKLTPYEGFLASLLTLGSSESQENRLLALRAFQNVSADQTSKPRLAVDSVLTFLTACAVRKDDDEREAAVSTLQNISTEPGAVVAITNTKNAIATLVHLAHSPSTKPNTRLLACEALANISLWLQTLAGTGKVPQGVENLLLPTLKTSGWEKWD